MPNNIEVLCPHCGEKIERAHYRTPMTDVGSCAFTTSPYSESIIANDFDSDGTVCSDNDEGTTLFCPECDHDLNLSELRLVSETDNADDEDDELLEDTRTVKIADAPKEPFGGPFICANCHEWFVAECFKDHVKKSNSKKYYCENCLHS